MEKSPKQSQSLFKSVADRLSRFFRKNTSPEPEQPQKEEHSQVTPPPVQTAPLPEEGDGVEAVAPPAEAATTPEPDEGIQTEESASVHHPRKPRTLAPKVKAKPISDMEVEEQIEIIHRFVMDHISDEDLSVETMASQLKSSRTGLYQIMHGAFNVTPANYILDLRMKYAEKLLKGGTTPKETSLKCGFSDPKYFSKVFKKYHGVLPSVYRLQEGTDEPKE